ncbi:Uncharacterized protein Rs2_50610 [Raphanus sativus]|nr:Uncharacterized protein Rs2_50610 [Raphanus sativus]
MCDCDLKALFGEVTEEDKLLLERIRGKEDNTSPKYTDQEERNLINKQIRKSQNRVTAELGFDMASSSRTDTKIISNPFDPQCVVACFKRGVTEKDKLLLERIRGKEDNTRVQVHRSGGAQSHQQTDQEEPAALSRSRSQSIIFSDSLGGGY